MRNNGTSRQLVCLEYLKLTLTLDCNQAQFSWRRSSAKNLKVDDKEH